MAATAVSAPHDVPTTLNYYVPIGTEAPYQYIYHDPPAGKPASNVGDKAYEVVVHDARGREQEFSLDKNGFQFLHWPSVEKEFDDEERIKKQYYAEGEELLKKITGAKRVLVFDHTIRRWSPAENASDPQARAPRHVQRVHVDQTYEASVMRVKYFLPEEADRLLKSRVRLINVWRPLYHPVAHHPLGVSDWRHLDEADLVPIRFIYSDREGGVYSVNYNPEHKWYYLSSQTPDEVTLIKCYDSDEDKARLTPHSAFTDVSSPKEAPERESIEIRALVFDAE